MGFAENVWDRNLESREVLVFVCCVALPIVVEYLNGICVCLQFTASYHIVRIVSHCVVWYRVVS
jgi:hypothetical protein